MNKDGVPVYSEVLLFMDRDINQKREFVEIRTESGSKITVTPAHLLLSTSLLSSQNVERRQKYVFADRIQEGDLLLVNINGSLVPDRVQRVSATLSRGVYAPLTVEGTIIVDNVVASCYALIDSQFVAHLSFMPFRVYNVISRWLTWTSSDSSSSISVIKQSSSSSSSVNSVLAEEDNSIDRNVISKGDENVLRKPITNVNIKTSGRVGGGVEPVPMADVQNGIHWYAMALYTIKDMALPSSWIYH